MNRLTSQILIEARKYIGHCEVTTNDSPLIRRWLKRVGVEKPSAWCAAYAWCMLDDAFKMFEVKNPVKPVAGVHKFATLAKVLGAWSSTPEPGFIGFHDSGKGQGHCGFVENVNNIETWVEGKMISCDDPLGTIEGNTDAAGSREGKYCTRKLRARDYFDLGYLDPGKLIGTL